MNNHGSAVAIELLFNDKRLSGFAISPDEYYWSCLNIFECDKSELTYDDIKYTSVNEIPENTFLHFPCSISIYKYCDTISIGFINNELHFRFSMSYNLSTWDENINFRGFFELLHDDIQQSMLLKVSDCYHDEQDYLLEVEFNGDMSESINNQVELVLNTVLEFHKFNVKNVI